MEQLIWGVIGAGDVVLKKSGPSLNLAERSRIKTVMRRNAAAARETADALGVPEAVDNAQAILNDPDINCVYIATPPASHKEYVLAAAKAGKHVLVEKPMGLSAADSAEMVAACKEAGVELFAAYYRRFHPHAVKMRELIESGRLGSVVAANIDFAFVCPPQFINGWKLNPAVNGGGHFPDVVSHRIDLLLSLLGPVDAVTGTSATLESASGIEDVAAGVIRFQNGAVASVSGDFISGRNIDGFSITGTKGRISTDRLDGQGFVFQNGKGDEEFVFEKDAGTHLNLIRHIESVLINGAENRCSGADGQVTDRVVDAVLGRA